jgi:hypothetical protein
VTSTRVAWTRGISNAGPSTRVAAAGLGVLFDKPGLRVVRALPGGGTGGPRLDDAKAKR